MCNWSIMKFLKIYTKTQIRVTQKHYALISTTLSIGQPFLKNNFRKFLRAKEQNHDLKVTSCYLFNKSILNTKYLSEIMLGPGGSINHQPS